MMRQGLRIGPLAAESFTRMTINELLHWDVVCVFLLRFAAIHFALAGGRPVLLGPDVMPASVH
jgi:hypothetical protein